MALQNITHFFPNTFLQDSALTKTLGEEFVLCENGNMVFHWADFFETCDLIKNQMISDETLHEDFKAREASLKRLNMIPVWIRTKSKIHQTTMHDLYEKYILNQIHLLGGVDPFCPIEISFISGTGPFKGMSIAECFNKATYRDFVLVYLLKDKLPRRDFRIRLKSKILMEYGDHFKDAELVNLEQLIMHGMLFSMESQVFMNKIAGQKSTRFLINTQMLEESLGKNLSDLKIHLSQYAFNLLYSSRKEDAISCDITDLTVQSSFDFAQNKKVYLFVGHDKLSEAHPHSMKVIKSFVASTKDLVKDFYQKNRIRKTA